MIEKSALRSNSRSAAELFGSIADDSGVLVYYDPLTGSRSKAILAESLRVREPPASIRPLR
jgi:hypothetical protein